MRHRALLFALLAPLCLTAQACPQEGHWQIQVDGYGLVRLTHADLAEALAGRRGVEARGLESSRLALHSRNKPVPILIEDGGDGWFGPGDHLLFFSVETPCLYTNTNIYRLAVDSDQRAVLRAPTAPAADTGLALEHSDRDVRHMVMQRTEAPGTTLTCKWSRFLTNWAPRHPDGSRRILVEVEVEPDKLAGKQVEVATPKRTRKLPVPPSGRVVVAYDRETDGVEKERGRLTVTTPQETRIAIAVKAVRPWDNGCTSVLLKKGPGQLVLHRLAKTPVYAYHTMENRLLWTEWRQSEGEPTLAIHLPDGKHRVLLATRKGLLAPRRVYLDAGAHDPGRAGESVYLALAPREFIPALTPHLARRLKDLGSARAVALEDVYQHYSQGQPDPEAIRTYLRRTGKGLRYLLLIGAAWRRSAAWGGHAHNTPARRFDTFATLPPLPYRPKGEEDWEPYAVDVPYGDLDSDGLPEVAVGRIPCRTKTELAAVLRKIQEYEEGQPPGPLARRVFIQAGLGRFDTRGGNKMLGAMLEGMLENIARKLVDSWVPAQYDLEAVYSSTSSDYFFAPSRFRQRVAAGLEKGFFAAFYIGHGNTRSYDTFSWRKRRYQTFQAEDAAQLDIQTLRGIYFALTCLSGTIALERGQLCMAAELCLNPRGPVGVVASSGRVSEQMNLLVTVSTLHAFFNDRVPRLGDLSHAVRKELPAKLHGEDLKMVLGMLNRVNKRKRTEAEMLRLGRYQYTLFGDPATKIRYPGKQLSIEPVGKLTRGGTVEVRGSVQSFATGTAWVSLELPRHQSRERPKSVSPKLSDAVAEAALARNNEMMNHRNLTTVKVPVAAGKFAATLTVPEKIRGRRVMIQVYATGGGTDAAACVECKLGR